MKSHNSKKITNDRSLVLLGVALEKPIGLSGLNEGMFQMLGISSSSSLSTNLILSMCCCVPLPRYIIALFAVALCLFATGPGRLASASDGTTKTPSFDLQGIARPKQEAFLRFPNIGQIRKIHASEGQQVQAGDLLVSLDDRAQAAEVAVARVAAESTASIKQAELALAQATRGLQLVLQARNVDASSSFEVEAKQNEQGQLVALLEQQRELRRSALAQLELAQVLQDQMTLRAPFSGQVVLINVKEGNMVDPDRTVVQIADLSNLEVELYLPTHLFGTLEIGERKWLLAGPPINRQLPANISYISPVIEPTGGTFLVRFEITNEEKALPAGFEVWYQDQ